jgi:single-stranded DNA-binding protein
MFTSTITIEGRLAEEPTVLENLTEIVVLTNRRKPNDAGEWVNTDTTRYVAKAFKTLGARAGEQLHKGDQVIVAGSVVTETWTDNDTNQNRYRQTVLADAIGASL